MRYRGRPVVAPAPPVIPEPALDDLPPGTLPVPQSSPKLPPRVLPPPQPGEEEPGDREQLLKQLHDSTEGVRMNAAMQLGRGRVRAAVSALIKLLREDSSPQVRDAAARALGLIGTATALDAL